MVLTLAVTVTAQVGITSMNVLPTTSSVVSVRAPAPAPVPVCPSLLAPGPDMGTMEAVVARLEVEDVELGVTALETEGVTVTVSTVTIGLPGIEVSRRCGLVVGGVDAYTTTWRSSRTAAVARAQQALRSAKRWGVYILSVRRLLWSRFLRCWCRDFSPPDR